MYRLSSRCNVDYNILGILPASLDPSIKYLDNIVHSTIFYNEDDIYAFIEPPIKLKNKSTHKNHNRLFSIYYCCHNIAHGPEIKDKFCYNMRLKTKKEVSTKFRGDGIHRLESTFKKINIAFDCEIKNFSDCLREINNVSYEGIFPLITVNDNFNKYTKKIHKMDLHPAQQYRYVVANDTDLKWLEYFIFKLESIQKCLLFLNNGGKGSLRFNNTTTQNILIEKIKYILENNNNSSSNDILDSVINPTIYDGNCYQIRIQDGFLSWHKNYSNVLKLHKLIPSKKFIDIIDDFRIETLINQYIDEKSLQRILIILEEKYKCISKDNDTNKDSEKIFYGSFD